LIVRPWKLCALIGLLGSGCGIDPPSPEGTMYQCGAPPRCPDGYACREGWCEPSGADVTDGSAGTDASEDEPGGDGSVPSDAPPIGEPGLGAPITRVFGEQSAADVQGVTTDTWIGSEVPDIGHGGDPEAQMDGAPERVTLIRFDLGAIPVGSAVDSAVLVWTSFDPLDSAGTLEAAPLLVPWNESATFNQASTGVPWPSVGAHGASVGEPVISGVTAPTEGVLTIPLPVEVAQAWVTVPATNYGLRWGTISANALKVYTREAADPDRPLLRVTFRPPL
jgi:hypothetical protein